MSGNAAVVGQIRALRNGSDMTDSELREMLRLIYLLLADAPTKEDALEALLSLLPEEERIREQIERLVRENERLKLEVQRLTRENERLSTQPDKSGKEEK